MRSFAPTGHRHTAEVVQALRLRGIDVRRPSQRDRRRQRPRRAGDGARVRQARHAERDIWKAYRETYSAEPFVRIVKERAGLYRYPEPKILAGSNYADVGFEIDAEPAASWRCARSTT